MQDERVSFASRRGYLKHHATRQAVQCRPPVPGSEPDVEVRTVVANTDREVFAFNREQALPPIVERSVDRQFSTVVKTVHLQLAGLCRTGREQPDCQQSRTQSN